MEILHKKVALSGKMVAGKSTLAKEFAKNMGFHVVSIGTAMKELAVMVIDKDFPSIRLFLKHLSSKEIKIKKVMKELLELTFNKQEVIKEKNGYYKKTDTVRKLLQDIATVLRGQFGEEVWVQYLLKKHEDLSPIIIDDVRLKVEKDFLEKNGYITLRLDIEKEEQIRRLKEVYGHFDEERLNHKTEIDLDNETFFARKKVKPNSIEECYQFFKDELSA